MSENLVYQIPRYCGICHSDVHMARDVVPMPIPFPLVPGHEIAGVVSKVRIDSMYITGYKNGYACFMAASVTNLLSNTLIMVGQIQICLLLMQLCLCSKMVIKFISVYQSRRYR